MTKVRNVITCLALFLFSFAEAVDPTALFFTWQRSPDTTITARWLTPTDKNPAHAEDLILYSKEGSGTWTETTGSHTDLPQNTPYYLHTVELTNLSPSTNYLFKIGKDGYGRTFKFRTLPSTLDPHIENQPNLRFVVGGDIYHDTIENLTLTNKQAAKTSPHFALLGGDIAYAAPKSARLLPSWMKKWFSSTAKQDSERWITWLKTWTDDMITPDGFCIPLIPAIGNHDCNGSFNVTPAEAPFFYALFPMPGLQGYNTLDFGNYMSLFILDSDHTHPIEGEQTEWLKKALEQREHVHTKFALYHVPAYPSARPFDNKYSTKIRENWTPLFDKYSLTAAFENHDHDFKRTHPLIAGKIVEKGVLYFGDGAWGVGNPRKPTDLSSRNYIAKALQATYFLLVEINAKEKTATAINSKGEIIDKYTGF